MANYANQKVILADKRENYEPGTFMTIKCAPQDMLYVINDLTKEELKLHHYLLRISPGKKWELSKVNVMKETGLSKTSYYRAVDGLINKGYLVLDANNIYVFIIVPISRN